MLVVSHNDIGINAVAVNDMSNDSMSWLAPVEMWTKSRLGYQQLSFMPCYVSGVATLAGVENKERRYHTLCKVANRTSHLVATLVHNVIGLGEGGLVECSFLAECVCPLLPNPCYKLAGLFSTKAQSKH